MNEQAVKIIRWFCWGQLGCVMVYLLFFGRPLTRTHMVLAGVSAMFALILPTLAEMNFQTNRELEEKRRKYLELENKLKNIRDLS